METVSHVVAITKAQSFCNAVPKVSAHADQVSKATNAIAAWLVTIICNLS